jgi:succinyl-CoA synthetase beta subunit
MKYGALITKTLIESGGYGNLIEYTTLVVFESKEQMTEYVKKQYNTTVRDNFKLIEFNPLSVEVQVTVSN